MKDYMQSLFIPKKYWVLPYIGSSNFSRSALTDGLNGIKKVTTKEVGHIVDKLRKHLKVGWENADFELFNKIFIRRN
jgi:HKD family nuclease